VEGLIEKLSIRLSQCADSSSGSAGFANKSARKENDDDDGSSKSPGHSLEMVSCLANALGAMNYTDKCILRLHDVVVVRKSLNVAISFHEVVRDNLLAIVERARKSKTGKTGAGQGDSGEGDTSGAAGEGPPSKSSGISAAASTALDAVEQLVISLVEGRVEGADVANAAVPIVDGIASIEVGVGEGPDIDAAVAAVPTPAKATSGTKGNKRKLDKADSEKPIMTRSAIAKGGAEDEMGEEQSKSRVAGKCRGRKPHPESKFQDTKKTGKLKAKPERQSKKRAADDDEDYEE